MVKVANPHGDFWGTEKQSENMKISKLNPAGKFTHAVNLQPPKPRRKKKEKK